MNKILILSEPVKYDWNDMEMIILIGVLCIPWIALLVYSFLKKYKITYFICDSLPEIKQYYKAKSKIILPENPIREGYRFMGWYTDPDCEDLFICEVMPGRNLRVFAKWEKLNN